MVLVPKLSIVFRHTCNNKYKEKDISRFISKINIIPGLGLNGDCWEWKGSLDKNGYGKSSYRKFSVRATKFGYELFTNKLVPKGLCICHKCDNPRCVNPYHLFIGTSQDNMIDKVNKRRQASGVGTGHAVLTKDIVVEIRDLYNNHNYKLKQLRDKFLVSESNLSQIINNTIWHDNNYIRNKIRKGSADFNMEKANKIRELYQTGNYTYMQLGDMFFISKSGVSQIINNIRWTQKTQENVRVKCQ
jgi:hypothetical protein